MCSLTSWTSLSLEWVATWDLVPSRFISSSMSNYRPLRSSFRLPGISDVYFLSETIVSSFPSTCSDSSSWGVGGLSVFRRASKERHVGLTVRVRRWVVRVIDSGGGMTVDAVRIGLLPIYQ